MASQGNLTRRVPGLHGGVSQLLHVLLDVGGDRDGVLYHSTGSDALDVAPRDAHSCCELLSYMYSSPL